MSKLALQLIEKAKKERASVLSLGNCGLTELPEELFELTWIEELYISNDYQDNETRKVKESANPGIQNHLSSLSPLISRLIHLKKLYCSGKYDQEWNIKDISPLKKLSQLTALHLDYNQIIDISPLKGLSQLTKLNLHNNQINDIFPIKNLSQLTILYLGSNQIRDIFPLKDLSHLKRLYLHNNLINNIGLIENFSQLSVLTLSDNQIRDISPLKDLFKLYVLYLNNNQISDISPLKNLSQLSELYLDNNQIIDISPLNDISQLSELSIGNNQISDISPLKDLTKLKTVYLNNNKITRLYRWVTRRKYRITYDEMWQDSYCELSNNPITHPPLEVVQQGHDAITRFFEDLEEAGQDRVYEAKLLLVGEGGVGKTTLRKKLHDPDAPMPTQEERTRGIDIDTYHFTNAQGTDIRINVWDFGGQDIYHATHRFFLTHRSFYILMTETRRQDDNFDYWIPNIHLFAGESPILVVKNRMEGFNRQIGMGEFLQNEQFKIVDRTCDVNLKDNTGLDELKKAIHYHIQRLPHMGQVLPSTWVKIRERVEELARTEQVISFPRFCEVCREHQVTEVQKIEDMGGYFHDLGIILWYRHIPLLKNKVILNPNWATNAVYLLIDDAAIQSKHGLFTKKDAARVWADKEYTKMIDELIELMKAFRLCYQKKKKKEYIIPSLLPFDPPPDLCWDDRDNLRLFFHYAFMPKGIANQLTAELHRYIEDDGCVWARGVIFEDKAEQVRAKVEEARVSKLLRISVKGKDARGFMRLIMESLREIHETYPGIRVSRQVPCPCATCINHKDPTIFSYDKLTRWMNEGKKAVVCNEGDKSLEIAAILHKIGAAPVTPGGIEKPRGIKVFISYSKADIDHIIQLKKFLKPLERMGDIQTWYDRDMMASDNWDRKIKQYLDTADIILFLVSPDFLNTDYILDIEIPLALERHESGKARVIPVVLRPCAWENPFTPFSKLLALPEKARPVTSYADQDSAWLKVFNGIRRLVNSLIDPGDEEREW